MKKMTALFRTSMDELKNIRTLTMTALFGCMSVVMGYFTIQIGDFLKIGFSSVVQQFVYYLFGPGTGMLFAGAMDILKFAVRPTGAFFPGYTLNAMAAAVIYGFFYYRQRITLRRVLAAQFLVAMVCNVCLGTLWWHMTTTQASAAFWPVFGVRLGKNLVQWPLNSLLFYGAWEFMEKAGVFREIRKHIYTRRV